MTYVQVGGTAGTAWEKKWWEEAYQSKLQLLQVHMSGPFALPRPSNATQSCVLNSSSQNLVTFHRTRTQV